MNDLILKYIIIGVSFAVAISSISLVSFFLIKVGIKSIITFTIDKIKNIFSFIAKEARITLKAIFLNPVEAILLMQSFKIFQYQINNHYELLEIIGSTILLAVIYLLKDKINPDDISKIMGTLSKKKDKIDKNEG